MRVLGTDVGNANSNVLCDLVRAIGAKIPHTYVCIVVRERHTPHIDAPGVVRYGCIPHTYAYTSCEINNT
jgi:hypothetical protein